VSQPSPLKRNFVSRFEKEKGPKRQFELWMARREKVLTFPSSFFFLMVAPLHLEELNGLVPSDMTLLI
jgi:hypothetical protein